MEPLKDKRWTSETSAVFEAVILNPPNILSRSENKLYTGKHRVSVISCLKVSLNTVFIRLTALGAYLIFGPLGWAFIRGGNLFEGGRLLFSQHFQQARTLLENTKTGDSKFISLQ